MDPNLLKSFEIYLRQRKCSWNTVSTYMKVLRAIYNRAVDNGYALYVPRLFKHVHTSVCADQRRALEVSDIGNLLCETEKAATCGSLPNRVANYEEHIRTHVLTTRYSVCRFGIFA